MLAVLGPSLIVAGLPLAAGASIWAYLRNPTSGLTRIALAVVAVEWIIGAVWLWRTVG